MGTRTGYSHAMAIAAAIDAVVVLVVIGLIALIRRTTARGWPSLDCTRRSPSRRTPWRSARRTTPPAAAPMTITCCPGWTRPQSRTPSSAVTPETGTTAACSKETLAGLAASRFRGAAAYSANEPLCQSRTPTPRSRRGFSGFAGHGQPARGGPSRVSQAPRASLADEDRAGSFRSLPREGQASGCNSMITIRKITRSLTAVVPGWLIIICGVCLAIPLARLAALLFTAGPGSASESPPRG